MVFVYFAGNDTDGKPMLCDQFKRATKKKPKYFSIIKQQYDISSTNRQQRNNLRFWKNVIEDHYKQIQSSVVGDEHDVFEPGQQGEHRNNIQVVLHSIIDILVDASYDLDDERLSRLTTGNPELDSLLKHCKASLVCLLLKNSDDTGRVNTQYSRTKKVLKYKEILGKYLMPYIEMMHVDGRIEVLMEAFNKYVFPLETVNLLNKKNTYRRKTSGSKTVEKPVTNFLFNKPKRLNDDRISIRTIRIREHDYENDWTIIQKGRTNRFMTKYPSAEENIVQCYFPICVRSEIVQNMLLNGITVNGDVYAFLGCSSEGLKFRKCFLWKGTEKDVEAIVHENGTFDNNIVSKRMARFGLLFSEVMMTCINIESKQIKTIEDIESDCKRYNFTDGCGAVGVDLASQITKEINRIDDTNLDENNPPSVFKIRLQGIKGVLALSKDVPGNTIHVRPSMEKFKTTAHPRLGVCDYSKPFTFGHLNRQYITLLSGLGVADHVFDELQTSHFDQVRNMSFNSADAILVLQWQKQTNLAKSVMETCQMEKLSKETFKCIKQLQADLSKSKSEKLKILVPESRYIFGVCDPYGILDYGECFLRITSTGGGLTNTVSGPVVVCKTPCYLLGDVRVLNAISEREKPEVAKLNHLVDCIVFPVRGHRPHPNEIAGSDLDGDTFFVSWDERLIPQKLYPPYDYPSAKSRPESYVTIPKMIMYFSNQSLAQNVTRKVAGFFQYWCDTEGIKSEKCQQLGMLFSRVIDAAKTGAPTRIPEALKPPVQKSTESRYIWKKMEARAKEFRSQYIKGFIEYDNEDVLHISDEFVKSVLVEPQSKLTEIEKFNFAWSHSSRSRIEEEDECEMFLRKFVQYIDFSQLSIAQKRHLMLHGIPLDVMMNALSRSELLSTNDLTWFTMHSAITPWTFYFRKENNELDWFYLTKALTNFENTCLMIGLPDKVVILLEFHTKCSLGMEQEIKPGSISVLFYSGNYGYKCRYTIGADYYLDLTDEVLQIYRNKKRADTFVWLKETGLKRDNGFLLFGEIVNTLSVDLSRFQRNISNNERPHPLLNKESLSQVEVYVGNDDKQTASHFDITESFADFPCEYTETEEIDDDDSGVEAINILSRKPTIFQDDLSLTEITYSLHTSAQQCNIFDFKNLLLRVDRYKDQLGNVEKDVIRDAIVLLDNVILKCIPGKIPEAITDSLDFCVTLETFARDMHTKMQMAELLTRLKSSDAAIIFLQMDTLKSNVTISMFLDIFRNWQLFWYLDTFVSNQFIDGITKLAVQNIKEVQADSSESEVYDIRRKEYIFHFGRLHCLALIQDMHKLKVQLTNEQRHHSNPSGVANLKLDTSQDRDMHIISLYALSALSYIPKIYEGQYVLVTRQIDLQRKPHYTSCCVIGLVQSVTQAPFRVELKIHGKVPDIVRQSLNSAQRRFWRCDVMANIVAYLRVVEALRIIGQDTLHDSKVPLLSMLTNPKFRQENSIPSINDDVGELLYSRNAQKTEGTSQKDIQLKSNVKGLTLIDHVGELLFSRNAQDTEGTSQNDIQLNSNVKGLTPTDGNTNDTKVTPSNHLQPEQSLCSYSLNKQQERALHTAMSHMVTCIQGPPGTGKTTVAYSIVESIVRSRKCKRSNRNKSVLVLAETNNAIDNIARKLRDTVFIVRLGTPEGIAPDIYDISLEGHVDRKAQLEARKTMITYSNDDVKRNTALYREVLDTFDVVLTTCVGAGDSLLDIYNFDYMLVDEATYTMETTLLCGLVRGCKHLVMIGDTNQMCPYLLQPNGISPTADLPSVTELSRTLFHRLFQSNRIHCVKLDVQYRMHPELLKFPSNEFYGNLLTADPSTKQLPAVVFPWHDHCRPLCFIDCKGEEKQIGTSYSNKQEAKLISSVVDKLLNVTDTDLNWFTKTKNVNTARLSIKDITVLTFYRGQVDTIKDTMEARVRINTVDSYQGCENDVIVVSTVRANKKGQLGFSEDRSRLNVMFTRAKRALVIVGNRNTLLASDIWVKWLADAPELHADTISVQPQKKTSFSYESTKPYTKSVSGRKTRQKTKFTS